MKVCELFKIPVNLSELQDFQGVHSDLGLGHSVIKLAGVARHASPAPAPSCQLIRLTNSALMRVNKWEVRDQLCASGQGWVGVHQLP